MRPRRAIAGLDILTVGLNPESQGLWFYSRADFLGSVLCGGRAPCGDRGSNTDTAERPKAKGPAEVGIVERPTQQYEDRLFLCKVMEAFRYPIPGNG